ncbi:hypothetical protein MUK42_00455 [Musa troglodytarum]|uniref:Uncharacterized protein n=1 Tax=Musa troglodytarum TaxID=320322 RepID=A0A9E7FEY4_9LILI|nr:hypothetical protein MUK42_00455 [Musa troglodytarum]
MGIKYTPDAWWGKGATVVDILGILGPPGPDLDRYKYRFKPRPAACSSSPSHSSVLRSPQIPPPSLSAVVDCLDLASVREPIPDASCSRFRC